MIEPQRDLPLHPSGALITPVILTYNEASNIARTLERLWWARQVLVVDSNSTDETLDICRRFSQVTVVQRAFDTHARQGNFALSQAHTPWVLSMDADYLLTNDFIREVQSLDLESGPDAYTVRFRYCVYGRELRGALYPPRTVLYLRDKASYYDDGHTQRVRVQGSLGTLRSFILHDDRKSLSRWLASQDRYMILEAQKLLDTPVHKLSRTDRIRRGKILAPALAFIYCLFVKQLILDGWPGWYYTCQRALAEMILAVRLVEAEHLSATQE